MNNDPVHNINASDFFQQPPAGEEMLTVNEVRLTAYEAALRAMEQRFSNFMFCRCVSEAQKYLTQSKFSSFFDQVSTVRLIFSIYDVYLF